MKQPIDKYAVFGNPIAQSQSPFIHQRFAEQTQQDLSYDKQLVELEQFHTAAEAFFTQGLGLNITAPFKLDAYAFASRLTERARVAGAVNTLTKKSDGEVVGDTTDGCGLVTDLTQNLKWSLSGKRILIIGAGGAVRGVLKPLLEENPKALFIYNRSVEKAQNLATAFKAFGPCQSCTAESLHEVVAKQNFDVIINGTSASLSNELPAMPESLLNKIVNGAACYDMVYAKAPTYFLQHCAKHGARSIADGLGMLVEQAAESFYLWRKLRPKTQPVIDALRQKI